MLLTWEDAGPLHARDFSIQLPAPTGPYGVGRRMFDWVDPLRADPFDPFSKRELVVWVWYPAPPQSGGFMCKYLPGEWGRRAAQWEALNLRIRSGSPFSALFHAPISVRSIEQTRIHAMDDALLLDRPGQRWPVLFFSPGLGKMPTDYSALLEELASYGYVVVGVNPTYFVPVTVFRNGRTVGEMPPWDSLPAKLQQEFPIWVDDLRFALNTIVRLSSDPHESLWNKLGPEKVGVFGHSYGGAAAIAFTASDMRVIAGIDIDGTPRGSKSGRNISKPFLLIQSQQGADGDETCLEFYRGLGHGSRVVLREASHRGFSDEAVFGLRGKIQHDLVGSADGRLIIRTTAAYVREFFDTYLRGKSSLRQCDPSAPLPGLLVEQSGASFCSSQGTPY
jgi:hypothetical protein